MVIDKKIYIYTICPEDGFVVLIQNNQIRSKHNDPTSKNDRVCLTHTVAVGQTGTQTRCLVVLARPQESLQGTLLFPPGSAGPDHFPAQLDAARSRRNLSLPRAGLRYDFMFFSDWRERTYRLLLLLLQLQNKEQISTAKWFICTSKHI